MTTAQEELLLAFKKKEIVTELFGEVATKLLIDQVGILELSDCLIELETTQKCTIELLTTTKFM